MGYRHDAFSGVVVRSQGVGQLLSGGISFSSEGDACHDQAPNLFIQQREQKLLTLFIMGHANRSS